MQKIYRTVSVTDGTKEFTKDELLKHYYQTGTKTGAMRPELDGEPKLLHFLGPMYDGEKDGKPVVRYETQEAYNYLSADY